MSPILAAQGHSRPPAPSASVRETAAVFAGLLLPTLSKGVTIRRPRMVALAERLDLDRRAIRRLQRLRARHGSGPILLNIPGRSLALILSPEQVHRVLDETPEPFATASMEKRAALGHFEPKRSLVSHGPERADRRRLNEDVLDHGRSMHRLAGRFVEVVEDEAGHLLAWTRRRQELSWHNFAVTWSRIVRRVVFGDAARNDWELLAVLAQLRSDANWAFKPRRAGTRERFFDCIDEHLSRAEPGSLASVIAATTPAGDDAAPSHQVPQWLFAFDPAGMTTFRSLALLAAFPEHAERAQEEIATATDSPPPLPFLRTIVLESLRLWPTTPLVLRETTQETSWENGTLPAGTGLIIFAPFFHRDDQRLPYADRLAPELWREERSAADWPLIPFSGGPGICPGRHLVLLVASTMLAALLRGHRFRLVPHDRLDPRRPLPATLNNYSLRFRVEERRRSA